MKLRFKTALLHCAASTAVVLACGYLFLAVVKNKQTRDLERYSIQLAKQVSGVESIHNYSANPNESKLVPDITTALQPLIQDSPYIEELTYVSPFRRVVCRVSQSPTAQPPAQVDTSKPLTNEDEGTALLLESSVYKVQLTGNEGERLGWLDIRWNERATTNFYRTLQSGLHYAAVITAVLTLLLSYFGIMQAYTAEQRRFTKQLSIILSGDYASRIDPQAFSNETAEIGTYVNRILSELESDKKKMSVIDDSVKQTDRNYAESLRVIENQNKSMQKMYEETQEGLRNLFSILWSGLVILDDEYRILYMNEEASRALSFSKQDGETIEDERLRRCLAPLVKLGTVNRIDDTCSWPRPNSSNAASCNVRATAIPSPAGQKIFFMLIEEENGFPKHHGSEYFSHRFVMDILNGEEYGAASQHADGGAQPTNERVWQCLRRIERYHQFEFGETGNAEPLRLSQWLERHFADDDLFSEFLHVHPQTQESDVQVTLPERLLGEFIDTALEIISWGPDNASEPFLRNMTVRSYVNSRGRPVIEIIIPQVTQDEANYYKDALGGRVQLVCDAQVEGGITIEQLEQDIRLSLFQYARKMLKAYAECAFSNEKNLATIRMVIDQNAFTSDIKEKPIQPQSETNETVNDLLRNFLSGAKKKNMDITT